ncbi:MAG: NifU N-terminal domain-containing protein [Longimicrobiales bacterium]
MNPIDVRVQRTPNPNAMKFSLGRPVVAGSASRTVSSAEAARGDPIAEPLFTIAGIQSIFMVADFVTVIKTPDAAWDELVPRIVSSLQEALH